MNHEINHFKEWLRQKRRELDLGFYDGAIFGAGIASIAGVSVYLIW